MKICAIESFKMVFLSTISTTIQIQGFIIPQHDQNKLISLLNSVRFQVGSDLNTGRCVKLCVNLTVMQNCIAFHHSLAINAYFS